MPPTTAASASPITGTAKGRTIAVGGQSAWVTPKYLQMKPAPGQQASTLLGETFQAAQGLSLLSTQAAILPNFTLASPATDTRAFSTEDSNLVTTFGPLWGRQGAATVNVTVNALGSVAPSRIVTDGVDTTMQVEESLVTWPTGHIKLPLVSYNDGVSALPPMAVVGNSLIIGGRNLPGALLTAAGATADCKTPLLRLTMNSSPQAPVLKYVCVSTSSQLSISALVAVSYLPGQPGVSVVFRLETGLHDINEQVVTGDGQFVKVAYDENLLSMQFFSDVIPLGITTLHSVHPSEDGDTFFISGAGPGPFRLVGPPPAPPPASSCADRPNVVGRVATLGYVSLASFAAPAYVVAATPKGDALLSFPSDEGTRLLEDWPAGAATPPLLTWLKPNNTISWIQRFGEGLALPKITSGTGSTGAGEMAVAVESGAPAMFNGQPTTGPALFVWAP